MDYVAFDRERKLFVVSGNSTSEMTEKRSARVWLNRSSCVSIQGCNSHSPTSLGEGSTLFRQNWYLLPYVVNFPLSRFYYLAHGAKP